MGQDISIESGKTADVQEAAVLDSLFNEAVLKSNSESVNDYTKSRYENLERSARLLYTLGNRARVKFWDVMVEVYIDRKHFFVTKERLKYVGKFASYLQEVFDIPPSTASSDVRVIKMLEREDNRSYLDSTADNLNFKLREIASIPKEGVQTELLREIETLSRDEVCKKVKAKKEEIKVLQTAKNEAKKKEKLEKKQLAEQEAAQKAQLEEQKKVKLEAELKAKLELEIRAELDVERKSKLDSTEPGGNLVSGTSGVGQETVPTTVA